MDTQVHVSLQDISQHFSELDDPRSTINRKHPLSSVLVIAILAVLCESDGPTQIARWAKLQEKTLVDLLPLPHGVPAKDVFRRVLMLLKPDAFQACFLDWLATLKQSAAKSTGVDQPVVSVDGKTLRRSHDRKHKLGALHSVSAWCSEFGLSLGEVATEAKSNEITAIPALLRLIDISGVIITFDAMGTQTAIAEQIVKGGGNYVMTLKGNQPGLSGAVQAYDEHHAKSDYAKIPAERYVTDEKGHGRIEHREYVQYPVPDDLPDRERWSGLNTIGVATLTCIRNGRETTETRYFISSLPMGVERFAHVVRSHWGIENSCHWSLDMTYREDESRIRERTLAENFAWLNRFTLSLLKQHPTKTSVRIKRRSCGWSFDFLLEVLGIKGT